MILTTVDKETIIFKIIGYQFDNFDNEYDANWLNFYVRFTSNDESWEEFDVGITTLNVVSLKSWFLSLAENKLFNEKKEFSFLDCNLAFELLNSEMNNVKQLAFTSVRNKRSIFIVSNNELMKIVHSLKKEIHFFPARTVEDLSIQPTDYHYPLFVQKDIVMEKYDPNKLIIPKNGIIPANKDKTTQNLSVFMLLSYSVLDSVLLDKKFFMLERELETILSESFNAILPITENGFVQYIDFKNESIVQHYEVVIADRCQQKESYRNKIRINTVELKVINATKNNLNNVR